MFPTVLACDFDGVICDGLAEYFASAKEAYEQIWTEEKLAVDDNLINNFYLLRPVIETGWEMLVLIKALVVNYTPQEIFSNWFSIRDQIVAEDKLDKKYCATTLDKVRDNWIENNLLSWLQLHRFYPGILDRLKQVIESETKLYIVTTKEGRFVKQLLEQEGIELNDSQIIGKECKRPKYETLRIIRDSTTDKNPNIWFIEDRIQALKEVLQQPDLREVKLFLADWGYNTKPEREIAEEGKDIKLLSLEQFTQDFEQWIA